MSLSSIKARLSALETQLACKPVPSFEEWQRQWSTFDELSKALLLAEASNAENIEALHQDARSRSYFQTISKYLHEMGLVTDSPKSLLDIAREMDNEGKV